MGDKMRIISLLFAVTIFLVFMGYSTPRQQTGVGSPLVAMDDFPIVGVTAPDFSLPILSGEQRLSPADYRGQPLIINFWTTWCGVCVHELPLFEEFYEQYNDQVKLIAVCSGTTPQQAEELIEKNAVTFPVVYDSGRKIAGIYQPPRPRDTRRIIAFPFTVFINRDGTIVYAKIGAFVTIGKLISLLQRAGISINKGTAAARTAAHTGLERKATQ